MCVAATIYASMEKSTAPSAGRHCNIQARRRQEVEEAIQQSPRNERRIESISVRLRKQDEIPIANDILLRDDDTQKNISTSRQKITPMAIAVGVPTITIPMAIPLGPSATVSSEVVCAEVVAEVVAEAIVEAVSTH